MRLIRLAFLLSRCIVVLIFFSDFVNSYEFRYGENLIYCPIWPMYKSDCFTTVKVLRGALTKLFLFQ